MKRLLLVAAFSISLLTLLAACGGSSSGDESSTQDGAYSQGSTSSATIEPTNTGDPGVVALTGSGSETDHDSEIQVYLGLMDSLETALRTSDTNDLSAESLAPITQIASRLEGFTQFFAGLDEEQKNYVYGTYGVELQRSAERVAEYALAVQQQRGDDAISQELARLPAFAIATTSTSSGPVTIQAEQVPDGDISTLLMVNDVSKLAGGVGLTTGQLDLKSMAANVNPAQVEHMVSFDSLSFETADGSQALTLTVVHLVSERSASDQMERMIEEGAPLENLAEGIGDVSGFIEANEGGVGSMVIFKKRAWVVLLHTAQSRDAAPLIDVSGVEALARLVADRL